MKLPVIVLVIILKMQEPDLTPKDIKTLTCIAQKESSMRPAAINDDLNVNGTSDYGLFQINSIWVEACGHEDPEELLDPYANIKCALHVKETQGFRAWTTYKKCKGKTT